MQLVLLVIASIYILLLVGFYLFRGKLIFQRTALPKTYAFAFSQPFEEYFITSPDNITLNALFFRSDKPSRGLIFYLHGNADDLQRWGKYAADFTNLGFDVFMIDYRGYGKSTGTPSESKLYLDATFALNWVSTHLPYKQLIIYGRSLGSAIASQLSIKAQPDLLILETPFASFKDVIYWPLKPALFLFPFDATFSNQEFLPKVTCRKVIFHGTSDWVVPLSSAEKLKPFLESSDDFIIIEGGGHRNLHDFKLYHDKLAEVLL